MSHRLAAPGSPHPLGAVPTAQVQAIIAAIADTQMRHRVSSSTALALTALTALERVRLPTAPFEGGDAPAGHRQRESELAPWALAAVMACNQLVAYLVGHFAPPALLPRAGAEPSLELEFDLVDTSSLKGDPPASGAGAAGPPSEPAALAAEAAHSLGGMLRTQIVLFGERLSHALQQRDPWPLLAELEDHKHRLGKAVQGILFALLAAFAPGVRREEILPAYRSAAREAVQLRAALADLSQHTNACNLALARASSAEGTGLVRDLFARLERFALRPAYGALRAEDKRAVVNFRHVLAGLSQGRGEGSLAAQRQAVEGFAKFLEAMHAINLREVLVVHDRQRLLEVEATLQQAARMADPKAAGHALEAAVAALEALRGRSPELDAARRVHAEEATPPLSIERWLRLVQSTLQAL